MAKLWWQEDDAAQILWPLLENLRNGPGAERRQFADDALALYFGNMRNGVNGDRGALAAFGPEPPSANIIQWCTDTLAARIMKNRVRPFILTDGGDGKEQNDAKCMQEAGEAALDDFGLYGPEAAKLVYDGLLFDGGGLKVCPEIVNNRMAGGRVFPWDVFVSEREARKGVPRSLIHSELCDRQVALETLGISKAARDAIRDAQPVSFDQAEKDDWMFEDDQVSDQIVIGEAYHLPSKRIDRQKAEAFKLGSHDGLRILFVNGHEIARAAWPYEYYPIAWFKPMPKPIGFWSRSIAETLAGEQLALNRLNTRIDGILHLHARPLLLLWKQAKVNPKAITNAWATILETAVSPSQALHQVVAQSIPSELFQQVERIIAWGEKKVGLNDMAMMGAKPPGVDHAPGMQMLDDEGTVRHTPYFKAWEQLHVDATKITLDGYRILAENNAKFEAVFANDKKLIRHEWKQVDLGEHRTVVKVYPTNLLPQLPGARASRAIDYMDRGIFTKEEVLQIIEYPDIKALIGDATAARENIERRIANLIRGGSYEENGPEPYLNLTLAQKLAAERINRLEADGAPEEQIEPLRDFFQGCTDQIKIATSPNPMLPAKAPLAPGAAPAPGGPAPVPAPLPAEQMPLPGIA